MSRRSRKTMAADCCPEGARLQAVVVDAIDDVVLAGALLADSDAYIAAVNSYQAHLATHGGDDTPPSAPHGDGGGVVPPKERVGALAEGASPMTPEPCWLCEDARYVCRWNYELMGCPDETLHRPNEGHTGPRHPCPACRVVELEAELARLREALQIASDMFRGEGWTKAEQGRIAQVRAALRSQAPAATSIDAHCTCHADYHERELVDPACGVERDGHHRRDERSPALTPERSSDHLKVMVEFNDEFFPSWHDEPLVYYSNALAGEVGEFCNCVKKLAGGGTRRNRIVSPEDARGELIDAWIYLGLAWMRMGGTSESFDAAFLAKMAEITRRMTERRGGPK